ncbi:MAG: hypothetical protein BKP49_00095 [Treponema sp. CETP13]|nr:MAG: hypothetical protein BKP49_00095 [Treponema sp. CETP13]
MKIAMITASPKVGKSASSILLKECKTWITTHTENSDTYEFVEIVLNKPIIEDSVLNKINSCDVLFFSFPLYEDSIPSHLLSCLVQLDQTNQEHVIDLKNKYVIALVNCGFYEGIQCEVALEIMQHWCTHTESIFIQGIGLGGGGCIEGIERVPVGVSVKKVLATVYSHILTVLAKCDLSLSDKNTDAIPGDNQYFSISMPRWLYLFSAHRMWKNAIRKNKRIA